MSRLVWLFSLKSHTQPGVDEAASNHSSHQGGNNFLHVRSLLPYLLTDIVQQMSRLARSNKGFTAHLPPPAPTCTHLHSPALTCTRAALPLHSRCAQARCKCALRASAVQVCAARKRGASVRWAQAWCKCALPRSGGARGSTQPALARCPTDAKRIYDRDCSRPHPHVSDLIGLSTWNGMGWGSRFRQPVIHPETMPLRS